MLRLARQPGLEAYADYLAYFNSRLVELCRRIPGRERDAVFLLFDYTGEHPLRGLHLFETFYAPAYSVLLHLAARDGRRLDPAQSADRPWLDALAFAMFLHPFDDHLCDGQIPLTPLTLQLRTAAWQEYERALHRIVNDKPELGATLETGLAEYFQAAGRSEAVADLEAYRARFLGQARTWSLVYELYGLLHLNAAERTILRRLLEAFAAAWRYLDDLSDEVEDRAAGSFTALGALDDSRSALVDAALRENANARLAAGKLQLETIVAELDALERLVNAQQDATAPATAPDTLSIEVTTACDLRCTNCFALAALPEKSGLRLDEALRQAERGYADGFRRLHLTGGEPTVWKPFFEFLDACTARFGYERIFFNTHGGYLSEDACGRLAGYGGVVDFSVSLNGPPDLHDAVRGPGTHAVALRGITNALAQELSVMIFTVAGRQLLPRLASFVRELFREHPRLRGLALIQVHRVTDDAYDVADDLLSPDQYIEFVRAAVELRAEGYPVVIQNNALANVVAGRLGLTLHRRSDHLARPGRLQVLRDGRITTAHSHREALADFEDRERVFADVLASAEYRQLAGGPAEVCRDCRYAGDCARYANPRPPLLAYNFDESDLYCRRVFAALDTQASARNSASNRPTVSGSSS